MASFFAPYFYLSLNIFEVICDETWPLASILA